MLRDFERADAIGSHWATRTFGELLIDCDADAFGIRRIRRRAMSSTTSAAPEENLAAVCAVRFGRTVDDLASTWAPYLTMSEGLRLASQAFTREPSRLWGRAA
jgi:hypothetical protein